MCFTPNKIKVPVEIAYYMNGSEDFLARSWNYRIQAVNLDIINEPDKFDIRFLYDAESGHSFLEYMSEGKAFMRHPSSSVIEDIKSDGEVFIGTIEAPYTFMDQCINFMIFEHKGYVYVFKLDDLMSEDGVAFKVNKDDYISFMNKIHKMIGVEQDIDFDSIKGENCAITFDE